MGELKAYKNVCVFAAPKTFHARIFPPSTIDFFMSNLALYWLSKDLDLPGLKGVLLSTYDSDNENG